MAILAVLFLIATSRPVKTYWARQKSKSDLERKLVRLKQQNRELLSEIERLESDPAFLKRYARRDLGYVDPNELEYRFVIKKSSR